mmetsp:Transcript_37947/g.96230  ORF Transcript_37947/g.96230 Transcript_37947/m.96230 type:complete len:203 (+) Transcript_37947:65-673(+)
MPAAAAEATMAETCQFGPDCCHRQCAPKSSRGKLSENHPVVTLLPLLRRGCRCNPPSGPLGAAGTCIRTSVLRCGGARALAAVEALEGPPLLDEPGPLEQLLLPLDVPHVAESAGELRQSYGHVAVLGSELALHDGNHPLQKLPLPCKVPEATMDHAETAQCGQDLVMLGAVVPLLYPQSPFEELLVSLRVAQVSISCAQDD